MRDYKNNFIIKVVLNIGEIDIFSEDMEGLNFLLYKYHNRRGIMIKVIKDCFLSFYHYKIVAPDAILYEIIRKWSVLNNVVIEITTLNKGEF